MRVKGKAPRSAGPASGVTGSNEALSWARRELEFCVARRTDWQPRTLAVMRAAGEEALGRRPSAERDVPGPLGTTTPDRQVRKGEVMKRSVRWALVSVGLAGVVTAMTVAPSGATPPSGLTNVPLARGTNTSDGTIPLKAGSDVAVAQITVNPGGSSGWHSHPGAQSWS